MYFSPDVFAETRRLSKCVWHDMFVRCVWLTIMFNYLAESVVSWRWECRFSSAVWAPLPRVCWIRLVSSGSRTPAPCGLIQSVIVQLLLPAIWMGDSYNQRPIFSLLDDLWTIGGYYLVIRLDYLMFFPIASFLDNKNISWCMDIILYLTKLSCFSAQHIFIHLLLQNWRSNLHQKY